MEGFACAWRDTDLPHVIKRMAEFALKRYKRLDKTEAKMYPIPDKALACSKISGAISGSGQAGK